MSQFKKFTANESENYNSGYVGPEGTLTWDPSNGLRIHDGNTYGGNTIGVTNYSQLSGLPTNPADFMSSSSGNDRQFLRYNKDTYQIEYTNDFKVVPASEVVYPAGTVGDKIGDVAFGVDYIYHCKSEPNNLGTVTLGASGGYSNEGWVTITTIPNGTPVVLGNKLTDGTHTSEVVEIIEGWPGYNGSRMIVRVNPAVGSWHGNSPSPSTLTVLNSGTTATTDNWSRFPALAAAPEHNDSPGRAGQIAFDDNYIYRCVISNVLEVSYVYDAPYGRNTSPYDWANQSAPDALRLFARGDSVAPQVGWTTSDGTNSRTITNVYTQNSGFGVIHDLTLNSGVDYSTATTITAYQTLPAAALWKRTPLNADTW